MNPSQLTLLCNKLPYNSAGTVDMTQCWYCRHDMQYYTWDITSQALVIETGTYQLPQISGQEFALFIHCTSSWPDVAHLVYLVMARYHTTIAPCHGHISHNHCTLPWPDITQSLYLVMARYCTTIVPCHGQISHNHCTLPWPDITQSLNLDMARYITQPLYLVMTVYSTQPLYLVMAR